MAYIKRNPILKKKQKRPDDNIVATIENEMNLKIRIDLTNVWLNHGLVKNQLVNVAR
jgi:hypothetical protein